MGPCRCHRRRYAFRPSGSRPNDCWRGCDGGGRAGRNRVCLTRGPIRVGQIPGRDSPQREGTIQIRHIILCNGPVGRQCGARSVELSTYADGKGNLDVQKLTCAQLANTFQNADFMTVWYSGWYNGLAGYSKLKVDRAKELEHRVIVYCKANPKTKVITAMDINIKQMRKEQGIKVNDEK